MNYTLNLNDRPFKAIKAGTKKIEGRTPTSWDKTPYDKLQKGDTIHFTNNVTGEEMDVEMLFVHHYSNTKSMLETEGVENVISGKPKTVEHGVKSYNSFEEYEESIKKNGIYAIGIKPIRQKS
jgi:ASC-1-like (ASCH) protein